MPKGHVYLLTNKRNGTLYCGVTNNLSSRIHNHREGRGSGFTKRYGLKLLVWYETYDMVTDAIQRETNIKRWPRRWKLDLIEQENPDWTDLYETLNQWRRMDGRIKSAHGETLEIQPQYSSQYRFPLFKDQIAEKSVVIIH